MTLHRFGNGAICIMGYEFFIKIGKDTPLTPLQRGIRPSEFIAFVFQNEF